MKNKKVLIIYTYLFLFAFTLGFSFTMASQAQAYDCCEIYDCPGYPEYVSKIGHFVKNVGCVYNGAPTCDFAYLCPGK